jgi:APA family basic amino acid/polyamine antiporter
MTQKHQATMGFWRTWGLSIGMMVGSGVFMLPTVLAPYGEYGLYSWLITGGGTIAMALSLAFMAKRVPKSGGPYAYTKAGFGDFAGFLTAWGYWISIWVSIAAVTVAFVGYFSEFVPSLKNSPNLSLMVGLFLIWSLVILNCRSVKGSSYLQLVTSLAKFLPLLLLAIFGAVNLEIANYKSLAQPQGGISALAAASALSMWAFIGFEVGTIPAGEIRDPARTIPRATIAAVLATTVLYVGVTVAAFGLLSSDELIASTAPLADAASALAGPAGAIFVAVIALIATGSGVNANIFAVGQMPMAAAMDGLFPKVFGKTTESGIPTRSFIIGGTLASIALSLNFVNGLIAAFEFLILLGTITALIPVAFSTASAWLFSLREPKFPRSQKIRYAFITLTGFAYALWAIAGSGRDSVFWGFLLLMAGVPVYVWITANNKKVTE